MLKFLLKLCLFIAIPLPIAFALQYFADTGLRFSRDYRYGVWDDIYKGKLGSDVWIMGSSRAWVHISPEILERSLGKSVYNLGIDAYSFVLQKQQFEIALNYNQKPRYVIYSLDYHTLFERADLYEKQQFIPFINDEKIYLATQRYAGHFTFFDRYLPLYKYRDDKDFLSLGLAAYFGHNHPSNERYKGYQGQEREWKETEFQDFLRSYPNGLVQEISAQDREDFEKYLLECQNLNIKIIFVFSPVYIEGQQAIKNREVIIDYYRNVASKYNIPLFDYSNDPLTQDKKYFYNSQHLNKLGAEIFSRKLAEDLKGIVNENKI